MTLEEIKDLFKIDLKDKKKTNIHFYLKMLYVQQEILKKRNQTEIGVDLNLMPSSIHCNLKAYRKYKDNKMFKIIEKGFKDKDIAYIDEFIEITKKQKKENKKAVKVNIVSNKEPILNRVPMSIVCVKLRHKITYLNNKPLNEWDVNDWNKYHKITIE